MRRNLCVKLNDELYDRITAFLNEHCKSESLSDKLREFWKSTLQSYAPTKEQFLENIKAGNEMRQIRQDEKLADRPNKCNYRTVRDDGKIDCAKWWLQKGKIQTVSEQFCNDCWSRREWSRKKQRPPSQAKPTAYYCALVNQTFQTKQKLPCITDRHHMIMPCPNIKCKFYPKIWKKEGD